ECVAPSCFQRQLHTQVKTCGVAADPVPVRCTRAAELVEVVAAQGDAVARLRDTRSASERETSSRRAHRGGRPGGQLTAGADPGPSQRDPLAKQGAGASSSAA